MFKCGLLRTTKSSQQAVDGFLLPTPRNISSEVTFCLNNISYLKMEKLYLHIPRFCVSHKNK